MSNKGRWDSWYKDVTNPQAYGDTVTYSKGAEFLEGLEIEDWGCGLGHFRQFIDPDLYRGIDGSWSKFADEVVDLEEYTSEVDGIFMRHVLEHNFNWSKVLTNAVASFRKKMVLVLFTPFVDETTQVGFYEPLGVPDLAFSKEDIVRHFDGVDWSLEEGLKTQTAYDVEHIFYLEKL